MYSIGKINQKIYKCITEDIITEEVIITDNQIQHIKDRHPEAYNKVLKNIQEAMKVTNKAVMEALDGLPPVKVHCSLLAEEAIHAALWDYAEKHNIKIEGLERPVNDISEKEEAPEEEY